MHLRIPLRTLAATLLLLSGLGTAAQAYELTGPGDTETAEALDDPSVRILAGHAPLPLQFALVSRDDGASAWPALSTAHPLPWLVTPDTPAPTPALRLWMPLSVAARSVRFTQAYFHLGGGAGPNPGDAGQWRPGAGVVMRLGAAPGMLQQMSLGSVFRLDMGTGSQVALRLKGGRLGVQYRLQFSL